jgi:hypothetical protein
MNTILALILSVVMLIIGAVLKVEKKGNGELEELLSSCQKKVSNLTNDLLGCKEKKTAYKTAIDSLNERIRDQIDTMDTLKSQIELLTEELKQAVIIPEIKDLLKDELIYSPWTDPQLDQYTLSILDEEYYTYPLIVWTEITMKITPIVLELVGQYYPDVNDCENFSLVYSAVMSLAFKESGINKQGAFVRARSPSHSYNGFVTDDKKIFILEPQTGSVVGLLGETEEPHDTYKVEFTA